MTPGSSEGTHTHTQQCTSPGGAVFTLTWGWGLISKNKEKLLEREPITSENNNLTRTKRKIMRKSH